ncbi:MAG: cytochrome c1 [Tepidimonas ignava]|uniref:Cytochrome c1 n=1 Tax=Tepidimonas ignava TaxID=114249 RepID=A0A4R3LLH3_9BURK|nr:cytochrome c1 [Tepidimonas ignava]TCS98656.1 ubiquinol-cytochrome c reductase cytochrome c1 subunit [Tepidimonas ignava]TSE20632.1 Cytochrome c1 [Tepidimonas ignava]
MKRWIATGLLALGALLGAHTAVHAAGTNFPMDKAPRLTNDQAALQHGAKIFVNYCLSCHSASFVRYNRLTELGLTEKQIKENLMFTTEKVGDPMVAAISPQQAKAWFGAQPPDLSLVARSRAGHGYSGADYLYTLLRGYYRDPNRPTGWNNVVFHNIGMPHPLWELQGERKPIFEKVASHGHEAEVFKGWEQVKPGLLTPEEYDRTVADLVAYLEWMGEPVKNSRVRLGVWVMIFLGLFTVVAWRLNAAYWKDVK